MGQRSSEAAVSNDKAAPAPAEERRAFEAWHWQEYGSAQWTGSRYFYDATQSRWEAWEAARRTRSTGAQAPAAAPEPVAWTYEGFCVDNPAVRNWGEHVTKDRPAEGPNVRNIRPLVYAGAAPPPMPVITEGHVATLTVSTQKPLNVDTLAQTIRIVDGQHNLGAGSLAEAILDAIGPLYVGR